MFKEKHGTCSQPPTIACECEAGWQGTFCHEEKAKTTVRPLDFMAYWTHNTFTPTKRNNANHNANNNANNATATATATAAASGETEDSLRPVDELYCVCLEGYSGDKCEESVFGSEDGIECICDPGYIGVFCHQPCPVECVYGECMVFPNSTAYCSCQLNYTGANCSEIRVFPDSASAGLFLVLIVLLVVVPYVMWKRGHIFFMKIVYRFQSFEDDDDKLYDAFVSYKSSDVDERFVVTQLFPKLEQELNFRLCLHFRDFIPGDTIANNIIRGVENSRRTILVLTPDFVKSEFCRFEYQRAQVEMLKRKQRIIPIVLRDVSREKRHMDESLRAILETITYLDWPADNDSKKIEKFWKRLELSMPKKKSSVWSL
nr:hypothetical protein BaRGS_020345 [Batillaria attramentaria]